MLTINKTDKAFGILLILCSVFWVLAKIPVSFKFIPFSIVYYSGWLIITILTIVCTMYFLYKCIRNKFNLSKIHFYGFLLGLLTLIIMRFIY